MPRVKRYLQSMMLEFMALMLAVPLMYLWTGIFRGSWFGIYVIVAIVHVVLRSKLQQEGMPRLWRLSLVVTGFALIALLLASTSARSLFV